MDSTYEVFAWLQWYKKYILVKLSMTYMSYNIEESLFFRTYKNYKGINLNFFIKWSSSYFKYSLFLRIFTFYLL